MALNKILSFALITAFLLGGSSRLLADDEDCALAMTVPHRLIKISSSESEVVYRDRKTNAILTFTKAGVTDYEFNLEFTAQQVYEELQEDDSFRNAKLTVDDNAEHEIYLLSWQRNGTSPNQKNDNFDMALMDICGQYYTFTLNSPSPDKKEFNELFSAIISTIEKTNT